MNAIKIQVNSSPHGFCNEPPHVQQSWMGIIFEAAKENKRSQFIRSGDTYLVDSRYAIGRLDSHSAEAARWYRLHTTFFDLPQMFEFPAAICLELPSGTGGETNDQVPSLQQNEPDSNKSRFKTVLSVLRQAVDDVEGEPVLSKKV